jgi:hypothetical protein
MKAINDRIKGAKFLTPQIILKTLEQINLGIFFILDHILLLNKIGAMAFKPSFIKNVAWYSDFCWGGETVCCLLSDLVDYSAQKESLKALSNGLKKIENKESIEYKEISNRLRAAKFERTKTTLDIFRCLSDLPVLHNF